ncbi:MAG: phosphate ABC transporter permease PstA [Acidimicrobiales bacterium]
MTTTDDRREPLPGGMAPVPPGPPTPPVPPGQTGPPPGQPPWQGPQGYDRPVRQKSVSSAMLLEAWGSAVSGLALVWVVFAVEGITAPFGMAVAWFGAFFTIYGVLCWRLHGILTAKDRMATLAIWGGALVALGALAFVIGYVIFKGFTAVFSDFPHFLTADMTRLGGRAKITDVGVGAAIVGTIEQVGIATIITVPLGIMTATYLASSIGLFARTVSYVVDAMTGAPAIIAGLFIYLLWVAPHHHSGKSGLAAALALAVMMFPIVTRAAQEVVAIVPGSLREAALALGAPEWRVLVRVVLPTARAGLITAVILGVARIAGETAPVFFTAGGLESYNWNPFVGQQDDLPLRIYENIFQPGGVITQSAWGASFVLVCLVLTLFLIARQLGKSAPGRRSAFAPWTWRRSSATQGMG